MKLYLPRTMTHRISLATCLAGLFASHTTFAAKPSIQGGPTAAPPSSSLIETGKFRSPLAKKNLPFRVFAPKGKVDTALPVVVYLVNLAAPRLGTVSNDELIHSFLQRNMLVVEVDYEGVKKAAGAGMYIDVMYLYRIFGGNLGVKPDSKPGEFPPLLNEFIGWDPQATATYEKFTTRRNGKVVDYDLDPRWVYVIPEGYTIDRDIEVATIASGRAEIVHRMDVIHPAAPEKPVPAVMEISTSSPASDPAYHNRINRNSCYPFTWMMDGYAAVMLDNVANFATSETIYGEPMTVPTGPHFPEKRALRLLRARKSDWGLSGKVAVMGISKSCLRAVMAGLIGNERPGKKYAVEMEKGPHADQSDRFDAMIAGGFPRPTDQWSAIEDFLTVDDPPLVWCQSTYLSRMKRSSYVDDLWHKEQFLRGTIEKKSDALGVPYQTHFGTPIGHDFDYVNLRFILSFLEPYLK